MRVDIENQLIRNNKSVVVTFDDICKFINPNPNDIIYLGGSLIEGVVGKCTKGMGNKYSDIDVFIIREENDFELTNAVYSNSVRKIYFDNYMELGFDVEVFNIKYVNLLIDAIDKTEIIEDERIANIYKDVLQTGNDLEFINSFLNRIINSVCVYNYINYIQIKNKINVDKFLEIMNLYIITEVDNTRFDVIGNIDEGQLDVALYCMRSILYNIMNIVLVLVYNYGHGKLNIL